MFLLLLVLDEHLLPACRYILFGYIIVGFETAEVFLGAVLKTQPSIPSHHHGS